MIILRVRYGRELKFALTGKFDFFKYVTSFSKRSNINSGLENIFSEADE